MMDGYNSWGMDMGNGYWFGWIVGLIFLIVIIVLIFKVVNKKKQ